MSVLIVIVTLIIMLLPVSEADAETSASDFRMEGSTLVKYRGTEKNVTIPDTVEVIGRSAFEDNKDVELVVLSNSVRRIDPYAFWGCENLDTVVLGTGLSAVGDYAFTKCTGLEQMTLPSNITAIGIQAFGDCTSLRNISIPAQTTSIHETAFDGCYQLTFHCDSGTVADEYAKAFYEKQQRTAFQLQYLIQSIQIIAKLKIQKLKIQKRLLRQNLQRQSLKQRLCHLILMKYPEACWVLLI